MVMISLRDMFAFLLSGSSRLSLAIIPLLRSSWILSFDFPVLSFMCFSVYVKVECRARMILAIPEFCRFLILWSILPSGMSGCLSDSPSRLQPRHISCLGFLGKDIGFA